MGLLKRDREKSRAQIFGQTGANVFLAIDRDFTRRIRAPAAIREPAMIRDPVAGSR